MAGLSALRFAVGDSVPCADRLGVTPLLRSVKANSSWFFCRLSPMSRAAYSPLPLPCFSQDRSGLRPLRNYYTLC